MVITYLTQIPLHCTYNTHSETNYWGSPRTLPILEELREKEELRNKLFDIGGWFIRRQPPCRGEFVERAVSYVEVPPLKREEHVSEGGQSYQEVEDYAAVWVVGTIVVRFGRLIGLSRGRAVGVATLSIQKLGGGGEGW